MPDYDYELVVVGGGPAGEKGAAQAAYFGHKTIVIEAYRELGGACINWGTLASKTLRESGVVQSKIQPSNRCFLFIDYEKSSYIGGLMVDDSVFCDQIAKLLQGCCNRPIAEIGGFELPGRATGRVDSSSWLSGNPRRDLRTG